jgi:cell division protein FtsX
VTKTLKTPLELIQPTKEKKMDKLKAYAAAAGQNKQLVAVTAIASAGLALVIENGIRIAILKKKA